jgi:hypothetical protein
LFELVYERAVWQQRGLFYSGVIVSIDIPTGGSKFSLFLRDEAPK